MDLLWLWHPPPRAALMTHWCSLGDASLSRGSMLFESRSILCRVFQVQCRRLSWMLSFQSRDFTRGMLARCRWYHRVAKVCSRAYGRRRISSVTKVCSSAYGARRISSVTKVCSSAYGARCISSGVVMPRAWAGCSLVFGKTSYIAKRFVLQGNMRHVPCRLRSLVVGLRESPTG